MDVTRVAVGPQPGLAAGRLTLATIALAALAAVGFFIVVALPYLTLDERVLARYGTRQGWVLLHVGAGTVALLTGPLQLWMGASRRAMRVHRRLGLAYVASVGVGAAAAFYLAATTTFGLAFGAGLSSLGAAWILTTGVAVAAVRRGFIDQHREWMIRSYVVTFAFVTFRALWGALAVAGIGTRPEQLVVCSWLCWSVPLLVTESVLQGRKIFGTRHLAVAALASMALSIPLPAAAQARLTAADLHGAGSDRM